MQIIIKRSKKRERNIGFRRNKIFWIHLVNELLYKDHNVTIATRGITADIFGDKVKRIVFDRHDEEEIIKCLR